MPDITIITPVWNGLPYLKTCVESVIAQDFENWEMLISDDGSTDGSREYLSSLKDPRIHIFFQEINLGIFGNLNFLFAKAAGPITQILCQDDYFSSEESISRVLAFWRGAAAELGFVRCNSGQKLINSGRRFEYRALPDVITPDQADLMFFLFGCIPGNLSNVSLRTDLVSRVGGFNQSLPFAGDFEFWIRAARVVSFGRTSDEWTKVRDHDGQASNHLNTKGELIPQLYGLIDELYGRLTN